MAGFKQGALQLRKIDASVASDPNFVKILVDSSYNLYMVDEYGIVHSVAGYNIISSGSDISVITSGGTKILSLNPTGVTSGTYGTSTAIPQITLDKNGRILSAFNVPISASGLGTVMYVGLNSNTLSISNSAITTSGTFIVNLSAVGTSGIYSKVVVDNYGRVVSGGNINYSDIPQLPYLPLSGGNASGTVTAPTLSASTLAGDIIYGNLTGIATQALSAYKSDQLKTARTFSISGDVNSNIKNFDGTGNVILSASLQNVGNQGTYTKVVTDTKGRVISGSTLTSSDIPDLSNNYVLTSGDTMTGGLIAPTLSATNISATNIFGIASQATSAFQADKLKTARTITLSGDVISVSSTFDGTSNVTFSLNLSSTGVTSGTYGSSNQIPSFIVDPDGRLLSARNISISIGTVSSVGLSSTSLSVSNSPITSSGTISVNLSSVGSSGIYTKVSTDSYGRVVSGSNFTSGDIPNLNYLPLSGGTLTGTLTYNNGAANTFGWFNSSNQLIGTSAITWNGNIIGVGSTSSNRISTPTLYLQQNPSVEGGSEIFLNAAGGSGGEDLASSKITMSNNRFRSATNSSFMFQKYNSSTSAWTNIWGTSGSGAFGTQFYGPVSVSSTLTLNTSTNGILKAINGVVNTYNLTSADIPTLNYLPLSGGTLTGQIITPSVSASQILSDNFIGALSGIATQALSAYKADQLKTSRTFSISGDVNSNNQIFDGTNNLILSATLSNIGTSGIYTKVSTDSKGRVISGTTLTSADLPVLNNLYLPISGGTLTGTLNGINISANNFYGNLTGIATQSTSAFQSDKLKTSRTFSISGDINSNVQNFDGTGNISFSTFLSSVGLSGIYTKVSTDSKGRVISGTTLISSDIPVLNYLPLSGGTLTGNLTVSPAFQSGVGAISLGSVNNAGFITFRRGSDGTDAGGVGFSSAAGESKELRYFTLAGNGYHSWYTNPGPLTEQMRLDLNGNLTLFNGTLKSNIISANNISAMNFYDTNFLNNKVLYSSGNIITESTISLSNLNYISAVSSDIQSQLNNKIDNSVFNNQSSGTFFSGPISGTSAYPTFRNITSSDVPVLSNLYLPLSGGVLTGDVSGTTFLLPSGIRVRSTVSDLINNSPWYGVGYTNLLSQAGTNYYTQLAGYWGVLIKTSTNTLTVGYTSGSLLFNNSPILTNNNYSIYLTNNYLPISGGTLTGILNGTNISANNFYGNLTGIATQSTSAFQSDKLKTSRTFSISGDINSNVQNFDGTGNVILSTTLSNIGTSGIYSKIVTDTKGRVVSGSSYTSGDFPQLSYLPLSGGTLTGNLVYTPANPNTLAWFDGSKILTGTSAITWDGNLLGVGYYTGYRVSNPTIVLRQDPGIEGGAELHMYAAGGSGGEEIASAKLIIGSFRIRSSTFPNFALQRYNNSLSAYSTMMGSTSTDTTNNGLTFYGPVSVSSTLTLNTSYNGILKATNGVVNTYNLTSGDIPVLNYLPLSGGILKSPGNLSVSGSFEVKNAIRYDSSNTVVGKNAGISVVQSNSTTSIFGGLAGFNLDTVGSYNNNFFGYAAGYNSISAHDNNFFGYDSGVSNINGSNNIYIGNNSSYNNISGSNNVTIGDNVGFYSTGNYNTFIGSNAASSLRTGNYNTFVGFLAGSNISAATNMLILDSYFRSTSAANINNSLIIGYAALTTNNQNLFLNANVNISENLKVIANISALNYYDTNFLNNKVLYSSGNMITESILNVSSLNYLSAVSSDIQTQFNNIRANYLPLSGGTLTGNLIVSSPYSSSVGAISLGSVNNAGFITFRRGSDGTDAAGVGFSSAAGESRELRYFTLAGNGYHSWYTNPGPLTEQMRLDLNGNLTLFNGTFKSNIISAANVTASNFTGNLTGIATQATSALQTDKLKTARTFSISGDVNSNIQNFDGTGNIVLNATLSTPYLPLSGGTLTDQVFSTSDIEIISATKVYSKYGKNYLQLRQNNGAAFGILSIDNSRFGYNAIFTMRNTIDNNTGLDVDGQIFTNNLSVSGTCILNTTLNGLLKATNGVVNAYNLLSSDIPQLSYLPLSGGTLTGNLTTTINPNLIYFSNASKVMTGSSALTWDGTALGVGTNVNITNPKLNLRQNPGVDGGAEISLGYAGNVSEEVASSKIYMGGYRFRSSTSQNFGLQKYNTSTLAWDFVLGINDATGILTKFYGPVSVSSTLTLNTSLNGIIKAVAGALSTATSSDFPQLSYLPLSGGTMTGSIFVNSYPGGVSPAIITNTGNGNFSTLALDYNSSSDMNTGSLRFANAAYVGSVGNTTQGGIFSNNSSSNSIYIKGYGDENYAGLYFGHIANNMFIGSSRVTGYNTLHIGADSIIISAMANTNTLVIPNSVTTFGRVGYIDYNYITMYDGLINIGSCSFRNNVNISDYGGNQLSVYTSARFYGKTTYNDYSYFNSNIYSYGTANFQNITGQIASISAVSASSVFVNITSIPDGYNYYNLYPSTTNTYFRNYRLPIPTNPKTIVVFCGEWFPSTNGVTILAPSGRIIYDSQGNNAAGYINARSALTLNFDGVNWWCAYSELTQ